MISYASVILYDFHFNVFKIFMFNNYQVWPSWLDCMFHIFYVCIEAAI